MSITTPINGFQLPSLGDPANIESAVRPLGLAVDNVVVPRFSTTTARDAAITAPSFGQMAAVSGTSELYYYNGSAWVGAVPRVFFKAADENVANSTLQDDNHLNFSVEANSRYIAKYILWVASTTNLGDLKVNFTLPASATRKSAMTSLSEGGSLNFDTCYMQFSTAADLKSAALNGFNYCLIHSLFTIGATSGNVTMQWAQMTTNATATTLQQDSYCEVLKVA